MSGLHSHGYKNKVDHLMDLFFGAGVASHSDIIEQLNYLMFLRAVWKKDEEARLLDGDKAQLILTGELSKFKWDNILSLQGLPLFNTLEEAYRQIPDTTNDKVIKLVFQNAHVKLFEYATLRRVIHEIDDFMRELEKTSQDTARDVFGEMYEYLLSKLASAGTGGQFRTPRHIIKFMVAVLDPQKDETILDPACGTGGFLVASFDYLKQKYTSEKFIKQERYPTDILNAKERKFLYQDALTGFDSDSSMVKFGLMNLFLHGLEHPKIQRQNTLTDTAGNYDTWDIILANPPFAGKIDKNSVAEELQIGTGATELLFMEYFHRHLSQVGRSGVIVPEGVVFGGTNAHKRIRKQLLAEDGLWCVVSLPSGVFNPYAGVKTSILFFDKTKAKSNKEILFVKISNDGFDLGAQRRPNEKNDFPQALEEIKNFRNSPLEGCPPKADGVDIFAVPKSKIAETGDYNLSGDRYRVATDYSNAKWPMVELGELENDEKIKFLRGQGLSKSDLSVEGKNKCIHYGEIYTLYDPIINFVISRTDFDGKVKSIKGDVLVPATTTADALGISVARSLNENGVIIGGDINIIRTENKYILSDYLAHLISNPPLKIQLSKLAKGANILHLSKSDLKRLKIPLPPLEIQQRIVAELDGYQAIINGAKQIAKNWKPKIDIDPKWEKVKLGEVGKISMCKRIFKEQTTVGGDIPFYKIGTFGKVPDAFISREIFNDYKAKFSYPKKGEVLISTSGTIGRTVVFDGEPAYFQDSNIVWIDNDEKKVINPFLHLILQNINWIPERGGIIARLYNKIIEQTLINVPSKEVQKQIVEKIEAERTLVDSAKKLIDIYETKTKQTIAKLWEE